ncbi:hypothetical protein HK16_04555 [Acetobacter senegalensis]|uniref:Uncharacterized protein n=3 Tax=Acetobacteraceae TaxID=433 RepID=A0A252EDH6_9PROT|nr:hypothetical protein CIW82_00055 [Acetobacter tropicalis]OUL64531.1 hypothetical protein HK16_04555 [Acetobacter senegalensis]
MKRPIMRTKNKKTVIKPAASGGVPRKRRPVAEVFHEADLTVDQGSLIRWVRQNFDELDSQWQNGRVCWPLFMEVINTLDLKDSRGHSPSLGSVKKLWQRAKAERLAQKKFTSALVKKQHSQTVKNRSGRCSGEAEPQAERKASPQAPLAPAHHRSADMGIDDLFRTIDRHTLPMPSRRKRR